MALFTSFLDSLRNDEEGQGLAEYALILALIAIVAIVALIFLGGQISGILNTVVKSVRDSIPSAGVANKQRPVADGLPSSSRLAATEPVTLVDSRKKGGHARL